MSAQPALAAEPIPAADPGTQAYATGDPPPEYYDGGVFDYYSRALFWFDRQFYDGLNAVTELVVGSDAVHASETANPEHRKAAGLPGPSATAIGRGLGNMAVNMVNEPVTAVASLLGGDVSTSLNAVSRFGINSTVGILGWNDVARDWGFEPKVADIGLTLCKAGVGEGGYLVLPFIGPRTVRDGFADVILVNAILWPLTAAALGTGASWQTILVAEGIEIVADIVATRQIDPNAKVVHFDDFEAVRAAYLQQRRARCADLRAGKPAPAVHPVPVAEIAKGERK